MSGRLILSVFLSVCFLGSHGQNAQSIVEETVSYDGVRAKIEFLASDELRGRQTPSPEQTIAANYLALRMKEWGVKTAPGMDGYLQRVGLKTVTPPSDGSFETKDSTYAMGDDMALLKGGPANFEAKVVFLDYGSEEDFEKTKVEGKIVVVRLGEKGETSLQKAFYAGKRKRETAAEKGALAVIELYTSTRISWKLIKNYIGGPSMSLDNEEEQKKTIPYIWIDDSSNSKAEYFKSLKGKSRLNISGASTDRFFANNVVGMVEGTDSELKEEIVVYSAHYDHVGVGQPDAMGDSIYNGTRDNAIGSVTVLEAAHNIAMKPLKRTALFIFFTGEEKGLLGSEWFVDHSVVPLDKIVMCFNSDNAGYNDTTLTTIIGLERTTATDAFVSAGEAYGLGTIGDQMPDQNLFDRSDQVNFAQKGIPAVMYGMGVTAFDDELLKYYHQAGDNPESVDYDYLYKFTKAYVHACRLVGNMDERPYWTEGDKYYDAGEELYKKK